MPLPTRPVTPRPGRQVCNSHFRRLKSRPTLELLEDRKLLSTFWVKNTSDSGAGSLRQAVLDANGNPGADTIKFKDAAAGTITLASQLTITGDTTIKGPGADKLTVSGGGTTRVLEIAKGANVSIEKLTIAKGYVKGIDGAGIVNEGNLDLKKSVVTGNTAAADFIPYTYSYGGYEYTYYIPEGGRGGGILSSGTLTVEDSTISGNSADQQGGGILNTGTLMVKDSTLKGNSADSLGGGIFNGSPTGPYVNPPLATLSVEDSLITENNASSSGGGIENYYGGNATIQDSLVSKNTCTGDGAGIRSERSLTAALTTLTIEDSIISGNTSGPFGTGGLAAGGTLTIQGTLIRGNAGAAAGVYLMGGGDALISRSSITDNTPTNNFGYAVGGIWSYSRGKTRIEDTTVSDNVGGFAGGIYNGFGGPLEIVRSTISGNSATPHGSGAGGVWGPAQIDDSTISGNTVSGASIPVGSFVPVVAGGVLSRGSSSITHSTIAFNSIVNAPTGTSQFSGGVTVAPGSSLSISNTIVATNSANVGEQDVNGSFASGGHNLIGILTGGSTGFLASDLSGTAATPLDPRLKPLGWYGGPTQTHAPYKDSPAINGGDNMGAPATDQRGRPRIVGGTIDIGAVEAKSGGDDDDHHHGGDGCGFGSGSGQSDFGWENTARGGTRSIVDEALATIDVQEQRRARTWTGQSARRSVSLAGV